MTSSRRSGVSVSEASVTTGAPTGGAPGKSAPTAETDPVRMPPESVTGLCIFPRLLHDLQDPPGHGVRVSPGAFRELAMRGGIEAEALDPDLHLVRADRPGGVELLRRLRKESGRRDDPVGADLERDLLDSPGVHLHERSLRSYSRPPVPVNGHIRRNLTPGFGHSAQRGPCLDRAMGLSMPVVWSERHRLHEPGGEVYVGVRTPGTELAARAERIRDAAEQAGAAIVPAVEHTDDEALALHDRGMIEYLRSAWDEWQRSGLWADPGQDRVVPYLFPHPGLVGAQEFGPAGDVAARAGTFCFDTMTLIGPGTWEAARSALDVALTAADLTVDG